MNDKRILQLVKAACELDEFEAAVSGREPTLQGAPPRRSRLLRWAAIGLPVAAAVAFMSLRSAPLKISEFQAKAEQRAGSEPRYRCTLCVSRPAIVRLVLIDERLERWIIPIADDGEAYAKQVEERWVFNPPAHLNEDDPRGPVRAIYALAIATTVQSPTVDELLAAIPDPIAPAGSDDAAVRTALQRVAEDLAARFGCAVRVEPFG